MIAISHRALPLALALLWLGRNAMAAPASPTLTVATPGQAAAGLKKDIEGLASFVGNWSCQGVFPANGKTIASHLRFAGDTEGAWLVVHHDDLPPNRFHALEVWGFDTTAQQYVSTIYDNSGGQRRFSSPGWEADKLIWTGETSHAEPPVTQRFVFERSSASQFVTNWEVRRGTGPWVVGDTLTCKREP